VLSVIGAISGIAGLIAISNASWRIPLIIVTVLFVLTFIIEHQKDRVTVLFSGIKRYYTSFELSENAGVFDRVHKSYKYYGISFESVKPAFSNWYLYGRRGTSKIQILLADPDVKDDEILKFQARYEIDAFQDHLTPEQQERIDRIVERAKQAISSTLATLATLPGSDTDIEVRLHRNRTRRWTHEVDDELLYLGMLKRGESGMNSPVLLLKRPQKHWTLFNHHHDGWEGLWQASRPVSLAKYKGAAGASP
jgi:hypothetical protein